LILFFNSWIFSVNSIILSSFSIKFCFNFLFEFFSVFILFNKLSTNFSCFNRIFSLVFFSFCKVLIWKFKFLIKFLFSSNFLISFWVIWMFSNFFFNSWFSCKILLYSSIEINLFSSFSISFWFSLFSFSFFSFSSFSSLLLAELFELFSSSD